MAKANGNCSQS